MYDQTWFLRDQWNMLQRWGSKTWETLSGELTFYKVVKIAHLVKKDTRIVPLQLCIAFYAPDNYYLLKNKKCLIDVKQHLEGSNFFHKKLRNCRSYSNNDVSRWWKYCL